MIDFSGKYNLTSLEHMNCFLTVKNLTFPGVCSVPTDVIVIMCTALQADLGSDLPVCLEQWISNLRRAFESLVINWMSALECTDYSRLFKDERPQWRQSLNDKTTHCSGKRMVECYVRATVTSYSMVCLVLFVFVKNVSMHVCDLSPIIRCHMLNFFVIMTSMSPKTSISLALFKHPRCEHIRQPFISSYAPGVF